MELIQFTLLLLQVASLIGPLVCGIGLIKIAKALKK